MNQWGVWVSAHQCWAHRINVGPNHPAWQGHSDGEVWMCALIDDTTPETFFWVPPGGPASPLPDPGELAEQAMGLLRLETAEVRVAPAYPDPTIVGVENWLWLPEAQWRPLTKTVTGWGDVGEGDGAPGERVVGHGSGADDVFRRRPAVAGGVG